MNPPCARCYKPVYPVEKLSILDKFWHKNCFRCTSCNTSLNLKTFKGFNKQPYCPAHYPKPEHSSIADDPESVRLQQQQKLISNIGYHKEFEENIKGHYTAIADDPERLRIKKNTQIQSQAAYRTDPASLQYTQVTDDPEIQRLKKNTEIQSNFKYKAGPGSIPHNLPTNEALSVNSAGMQQQSYIRNSQQGMGSSDNLLSNGSISTSSFLNNNQSNSPYISAQPPALKQNDAQIKQQILMQEQQRRMQFEKQQKQMEQQRQLESEQRRKQEIEMQKQQQFEKQQTEIIERQRQERIEQDRIQREEAERARQAMEEQRLLAAAEEEEKRRRLAEEDQRRQLVEEQRKRLAEEEQSRRLAAEGELRKRMAAEEEENRRQLAAEEERRLAEETDRMRLADEDEKMRHSSEIYRAEYDYQPDPNDPDSADELAFQEGDIIIDVVPIDDGWSTGTNRNTGLSGMLPSNYIVRIS